MKKVLAGCLVFISLFILNISSVSAQALSWDDVCKNFLLAVEDGEEMASDDNIKIKKEDNVLSISYSEDGLLYELNLEYNDGIVSYINTRNYLTEDERLVGIMLDQTFLDLFVINIIGLYNPNFTLDEIFETMQMLVDNKAVTTIEGESIYYDSLVSTYSSEISTTEIKEFKMDLVLVDSLLGAKKDDDIVNEDNQNNEVLEDENLIDNSKNDEISKSVQDDFENPKTLDASSSNYLLLSIIAILMICGLLISVFPKLKKVK